MTAFVKIRLLDQRGGFERARRPVSEYRGLCDRFCRRVGSGQWRDYELVDGVDYRDVGVCVHEHECGTPAGLPGHQCVALVPAGADRHEGPHRCCCGGRWLNRNSALRAMHSAYSSRVRNRRRRNRG